MAISNGLLLLLSNPYEFRTLVNFWLWHEGKRDITAKREHPTSGWDRDSMRRCWEFLDKTSRSFAAVIKELDGDLARTICLFYLVLRGLDTIEDDMTLPDEIKQPLLRQFYIHSATLNWTFSGSGPGEKDRQLLVEYDCVVSELASLEPSYREVILDITQKMGGGMADYAHAAVVKNTPTTVETIADYDLYCHYVAGLVGEGLSRLFAASGKEGAFLADQLVLSNSMGLLLQKTNILRDYREDVDQSRYFWPREIWGKHGFNHIGDLRTDGSHGTDATPAARRRALWALSEMTLDALRHTEDCLDYLSLLKNQSVFNFCAIPQTMAMATLALCFMNPDVLERNIKIRKAEAVTLIMKSTNPRDVAYLFRDYARAIHRKAVPGDPSYVKICVQCGRIEAWTERHFPSFIRLSAGAKAQMDPLDARSRIVRREQERDKQREQEKRDTKFRAALESHEALVARQLQPVQQQEESGMPWQLYAAMALFALLLAAIGLGAVLVFKTYDVFGDGKIASTPARSEL